MATNPPNKLRVMVDANVLFAGSGWPRFAYGVLQHAMSGDYQLVLSLRIIQEARTALEEIIPSQSKQFEEVLTTSAYEEVSTPTDEAIEANKALVRDPKDVHVALAAINAKVDYLVSSDKDLTDPNEPVHQYLKVLLPGTFLRQHMGWTSERLEAIRKRTWKDLLN